MKINNQENALEVIRARIGLSQTAFAEAIGLTERGYSDIARGLSPVRKIHLNSARWVEHTRGAQSAHNEHQNRHTATDNSRQHPAE